MKTFREYLAEAKLNEKEVGLNESDELYALNTSTEKIDKMIENNKSFNVGDEVIDNFNMLIKGSSMVDVYKRGLIYVDNNKNTLNVMDLPHGKTFIIKMKLNDLKKAIK